MNARYQQRRVADLSRDLDILMDRWIEAGGYASSKRQQSLIHQIRCTIERQFLPHYFYAPPRWRLTVREAFGRRTFPDFCVTGPPKAGTSDIATNLLVHPGVMLPLAKEIGPVEVRKCCIYYPTVREKRIHLERYGAALSPFLAPALHTLEIPQNLVQLNPRIKVVITLRNPIRRMYSHWKWEILRAGKSRIAALPFMRTFDAYVAKSLELFPLTPMFTACGSEGLRSSIYCQAVEYWIDCFGKENVLVLDSDEYFRDRTQFMNSLQAFVGLPRTTFPAIARKVNENPLQLQPPSTESLDNLRRFFESYNEKLWRIIGKTFEW